MDVGRTQHELARLPGRKCALTPAARSPLSSPDLAAHLPRSASMATCRFQLSVLSRRAYRFARSQVRAASRRFTASRDTRKTSRSISYQRARHTPLTGTSW